MSLSASLANRLACPWCGARVHLDEVSCGGCANAFKVVERAVSWQGRPIERAPLTARRLARIARYRLDPLASPYSPLVALGARRTRAYYERTLHDSGLARNWGEHYLPADLRPADGPVLDHGCGRGRNVALLRQLGYEVAGQDVVSDVFWSRIGGAGFQCVPAEAVRLPWNDGAFSLVLDFEVIGHFDEPALVRHFEEVRRVLQPGGRWLILEANSLGWAARMPRRHYGRLYSLEHVRRLAAALGFVEQRSGYEGFYAPAFPRLLNFLRKQCAPWPMDLSDHASWLARLTPAKRRALWQLLLARKP